MNNILVVIAIAISVWLTYTLATMPGTGREVDDFWHTPTNELSIQLAVEHPIRRDTPTPTPTEG